MPVFGDVGNHLIVVDAVIIEPELRDFFVREHPVLVPHEVGGKGQAVAFRHVVAARVPHPVRHDRNVPQVAQHDRDDVVVGARAIVVVVDDHLVAVTVEDEPRAVVARPDGVARCHDPVDLAGVDSVGDEFGDRGCELLAGDDHEHRHVFRHLFDNAVADAERVANQDPGGRFVLGDVANGSEGGRVVREERSGGFPGDRSLGRGGVDRQ